MEQIGIQRLTGIIAFARAASLGSYSAAARSLGLSPSAVSKSVQRLEQHLGVRLFGRTTRSLKLTPAGRDLHDRAVRLLEEAEAIEQAAVAARSEPAGVLRVSASLPIGIHAIAPSLPRFRERYPQLAIDLRLGDRIVDLNEEGIDVAIRVGDLKDSQLISRQLAPHCLCVVASPAYLARRGTPRRPDELAGHECVNFRFQSTGQTLRWSFGAARDSIELSPTFGITADSSDAVLAVVAAGGGISISPTVAAAPYVQRGDLVPVLNGLVKPRSSYTALWSESRRNNPGVKAFVRYLGEIFPSPTPWDAVFANYPAPPRSKNRVVARAAGSKRAE